MCLPAIAECRTVLGLSTICWVMPVSPAPEVRKLLGVVRVCSGKSILLAGLPIGKGLMLMSGIEGAADVPAVPWATIVVPCGMDARRATVLASLGSLVAGTEIQRPGSMCSPAFRFASEIC